MSKFKAGDRVIHKDTYRNGTVKHAGNIGYVTVLYDDNSMQECFENSLKLNDEPIITFYMETQTSNLTQHDNPNAQWFAVPPYIKTDSWQIVNLRGELVARFEDKDDCIECVKIWNQAKENQ